MSEQSKNPDSSSDLDLKLWKTKCVDLRVFHAYRAQICPPYRAITQSLYCVFVTFGPTSQHCSPAFCYHHSDNSWCFYSIVCLQVKVGELFGDFFSILSRHRVRLDSSFVNVMIAVVMVEGLGRGLNPDMDILHTLRKYLIKVWTGSYWRRVCSEVVAEHCAI